MKSVITTLAVAALLLTGCTREDTGADLAAAPGDANTAATTDTAATTSTATAETGEDAVTFVLGDMAGNSRSRYRSNDRFSLLFSRAGMHH